MNHQPLPSDSELDIQALSRIFNATTNSYKILFFRTILILLRRGDVDPTGRLSLITITTHMLATAWVISRYYKLTLGSQDQLLAILDQLQPSIPTVRLTNTAFGPILEEEIKKVLSRDALKVLNRYVLARLIRPFLQQETSELKDAAVDSFIAKAAAKSFDTTRPTPYRIEDDYLVLNERWLSYFHSHLRILSEWADWNLTVFLQARNPNSPSISRKLSLPDKRRSLQRHKLMWLALLEHDEVRCPYTGTIIKGGELHLDHYLPWSYVCHDEPWNLVPVNRLANSSKGDSLPSNEYLSSFLDLQSRAVSNAKLRLSIKDWDWICSSYADGLRLNSFEITKPDLFAESLKATISSGASIAMTMGFTSDWKYRSPINLAGH